MNRIPYFILPPAYSTCRRATQRAAAARRARVYQGILVRWTVRASVCVCVRLVEARARPHALLSAPPRRRRGAGTGRSASREAVLRRAVARHRAKLVAKGVERARTYNVSNWL